jgi:CRISPR/Cas system-associated exonuclease Cas4 (RecB family)
VLTGDELKAAAWTWSFSKFKRFLECREKYRLEYLESMKIPPLSRKPFFQGSVAHKVVEQTREKLVKGEVDSLRRAVDDLEAVFDSYAVGINWTGDDELIKARVEAAQILENYLGLLETHALDQGEIYCEHWFGTHAKPLIRPSGLRWVGAIDWLKIDREQGKAWIWDAKTSQGTQYLDKRQLVLYAMAVEQEFGVEVEDVGYLMLRWDKPIKHKVTAEEKAQLEAEMIEASQLVESGQFETAPMMRLCGPCQYAGHCSPYSHWIMNGGTSCTIFDSPPMMECSPIRQN